MKQISKIIANGILAMDNKVELIAQAIEANSRLATFLCGDCQKPSDEQIEAIAIAYCNKNGYKFNKITEVYLDGDFQWRATVAFSYIKYARTPDETNLYAAKSKEEGEYVFPVEFINTTNISL